MLFGIILTIQKKGVCAASICAIAPFTMTQERISAFCLSLINTVEHKKIESSQFRSLATIHFSSPSSLL